MRSSPFMIRPKLFRIMLGYEHNTVPCKAAVNVMQVAVKIFAPKLRLFVFVVENANSFIPQDLRALTNVVRFSPANDRQTS